MKAINKLTGILLGLLLVSACATVPYKLAEKYNFDNKLQVAEGIPNFRVDSWQSIDYQSLIVRTYTNHYYLIVLDQPAPQLPTSEDVGITISVDMVRSGFDNLIVEGSNGNTHSYIIQKIYKLKDQAQANQIREQLLAH